MATTDKPTTTADRELVLNRIIDAPREKVFKAWTDPALINSGSRLCPGRPPSRKPMFGGKTNYTARVRHWSVADREAREKMGFHQGWGQCADQLAALVAKL